MSSWKLTRSTGVEIPTPGAGAPRDSVHLTLCANVSLVVELLCLNVERGALLDRAEALDLEGGARFLDSRDPW